MIYIYLQGMKQGTLVNHYDEEILIRIGIRDIEKAYLPVTE